MNITPWNIMSTLVSLGLNGLIWAATLTYIPTIHTGTMLIFSFMGILVSASALVINFGVLVPTGSFLKRIIFIFIHLGLIGNSGFFVYRIFMEYLKVN